VSSTRWSFADKCVALRVHSMPWSQVLAQNRHFCLPHMHSMPPLWGYPSEYRHDVWYGKTRMVWLNGEKFFEDILIRFDRMYERDGWTDTARRLRPH